MGTGLIVVIAAIALAAAIGLALNARRTVVAREAAVVARQHTWAGDKITPAGLGPRNSAPERVARGQVLTQGVILAVVMARADGTIADAEVAAIRAFIEEQIPEADEGMARKALEDGLAHAPSEETIRQAIETIRAIGSDEQRHLVLQMLIAVAHTDGKLDIGERAFMERVGDGFGFGPDAVRELIDKAMTIGL
jgi:uncharacterized tellurite resistance protein B-like protein